MRTLTIAAFLAALTVSPPAIGDPPDPPDLSATVAQAMTQATAITDAVRSDAAATGERLSQAPTRTLYERYHVAGNGLPPAAAKPCDHPPVLEAGGLCIPPPARTHDRKPFP